MAQWGLGETRYLKARKSTGSDLEEALSPISTTITSTSNDTNATRSPRDRRRVPLTDLTTSTLSSRSSLFEPAHAVQPRTIQEVGYALNRPRTPGTIKTRKARFRFSWPSFFRRKPHNRDSVDTRFRPGEEAVSPKSPAQQMVRRMSSLGTAARTSAAVWKSTSASGAARR